MSRAKLNSLLEGVMRPDQPCTASPERAPRPLKPSTHRMSPVVSTRAHSSHSDTCMRPAHNSFALLNLPNRLHRPLLRSGSRVKPLSIYQRQAGNRSSRKGAAEAEKSFTEAWSWRAGVASLLAAGLLVLSPAASWAGDVGDIYVGPPRVVDGDTLVIAGERVRLYGLDAPETAQSCQDSSGNPYACGQVASNALREKIGSSSIQCYVRARDLYGRNVSACSLPGTGDLGDWLVKNGHAVAYRQYSKDYVEDEEAAKAAHKGIWQGSFEIPADWRREKKARNFEKRQHQHQHQQHGRLHRVGRPDSE